MKKVHSSPTEVAKRLRAARTLTGLNQEEFCSDGLVLRTYRGWEAAEYGGLSAKGAQKVASRLSELGVYCTTEWLLNNSGPGPIIDQLKTQASLDPSSKLYQSIKTFNDIAKLFLYEDLLFYEVDSDINNRFGSYKQGDIFYGIIQKDINALIDTQCIIDVGETIILGVLQKSQKEELVITNVINEQIMQDVTIKNAAIISGSLTNPHSAHS